LDEELDVNLRNPDLVYFVYPENMDKKWPAYELGALANKPICPYLIDIKSSDLKPPLNRYHSVQSTKDETLQLVRSINKTLNEVRKMKNYLIRILRFAGHFLKRS